MPTKEETIEIVFDPLSFEEMGYDFESLPEKDAEQLDALYAQVLGTPKKSTFDKLHALQKKYPNDPTILNFLTVAHKRNGDEEKARAILLQTYEQFPDYLFGRVMLATDTLLEGSPEKAFAILGKAYTLKQLYPHRSLFHVSELKCFAIFMAYYTITQNDYEQAGLNLDLLHEILDEDDPDLHTCVETCRTLLIENALRNLTRPPRKKRKR